MSWAGMRGVVTVATALALPESVTDGAPFPHRDDLVVVALVCVFVTLVVQGLTLAPLVARLGVAEEAGGDGGLGELRRRAAETALEHVRSASAGSVSDHVRRAAVAQYQGCLTARNAMAEVRAVTGDEQEEADQGSLTLPSGPAVPRTRLSLAPLPPSATRDPNHAYTSRYVSYSPAGDVWDLGGECKVGTQGTSTSLLHGEDFASLAASVDRSAASTAPLGTLLAEDFVVHFRSLVSPGLHALVVYRIGHWGLSQPAGVRQLVRVAHRIVNRLWIQNVYGTEISEEAFIGRRVGIAHHVGVQIPAFAVVGDDCVIRHNVTLGFTGRELQRLEVPRLGRGVEVGTGASLLGPITVGDGAKIGPHALVTVNVPAGATAFSPPARIMKASPEPTAGG